MLALRDVQKVYRNGLIETTALAGVTVHVQRGEFVAVMGPSGSGKTTLLNVAGLLDTIDGGDLVIDGTPAARLSDDALADLRNRHIGFVFQSFNLMQDLDVYDNVDVPLRYRGLSRRERREKVEAILGRVGLTARMHHLPRQLSGGQQQRVAIARAAVGEPSLILADEPTGNLDSLTARTIVDLLEELNRGGTTIVMVTHDHELASRAGRRLHMLDGRLIDQMRPSARSLRAAHLTSFLDGFARLARLPKPVPQEVAWGPFLATVQALQAFEILAVPDEPGWFDRAQLQQVLINLVKNAHEAGSGTVELRIEPHDGGVRLQVLDRGAGMTEEVRRKALQPFYSTKKSGGGIGLALSREIVDAHGGHIALAARDGGGTVVDVWLPGRP
ncbi:MAG: ATP-binding cassette domain-containing protein [Myxococcales bacterium]|nr:ATP-binding cassette domain-containing protein [Myxococcales bacterium]